jgi:uncharacterized protein (UPF0147 family)
MKEWLLVLKAADAAARWHVHQRRKGPAGEPYINHLLEVAMLVAEATGGKDTNLVVTALLHDAIEDCEVPKELIAETFGADVAALVQEITDDKNLPKAVRKDEQIKTAPKKSSRAKVLKLADKTSNLRAVAASPPANWSVKRRKESIRRSCGGGRTIVQTDAVKPAYRNTLIFPEPLEAILRQLRVSRSVLNVSVPKIRLQCAGILSVIRELVATGVAKHVSVSLDR